MKDETGRDERLSNLLRDLAPEPPAPRPDEEARIFAAVRREGGRRGIGWLPALRWGLPAFATAAAVAFLMVRQTSPVDDGDLESYLSQTIVAQYSETETEGGLPESGIRLLSLVYAD